MTSITGLLVADRRSDQMWLNLPDEERLPLLTYRGFDAGDRWPQVSPSIQNLIKNELAPIENFEVIRSYYESMRLLSGDSVDFIAIGDIEMNLNDPKINFIGFDIGALSDCGETVFFSVIINEMRKQGNQIYSEYLPLLNKFYLFDTISLAYEVLQARENVLRVGNNLHIETAYPCARDIVKIFSCA
jgi:hypothetical protein